MKNKPNKANQVAVAALRAELTRQNLAGFIIPRQDEFQGEYVAAYAERLKWLTGFAGSWGTAIFTLRKSAIFVDGRYTLQVKSQIDTRIFEPHHLVDSPPSEWIAKNLRKGERLGFDPWLVTAEQAERYRQACAKAAAKLVAVSSNPIDLVWKERPERPADSIETQPTQFAGKNAKDKLAEVAKALAKTNADAVVLTLPDSVAWAFNIRGRDVPYTPVVLAYAILKHKGKAELFVDPARIPEDARAQLKKIAVVKAPPSLAVSLRSLGRAGSSVQIDLSSTPEAIRGLLVRSGAKIIARTDPIILPKARKNRIEQEGARAAHRRDGAAMARFLCWFETAAPAGGLSEASVADKLQSFRAASGEFMDLSFETIAGSGPNSALPHYHVAAEASRPLASGEIFLIDSGAQYRDGTTDITRTLIVGEANGEMKDRYTRVLKGMIAISRIKFPKGTCGSQLDVLARAALWAAGFDYDHGTGHGVGSYLSVHEGPARINKTDRTPLEPGMILSNEPGLYKQGAYGIRIENLVLVREAHAVPGGERMMHSFETLTLCPIERRLIDQSLLTAEETGWFDAYHARVLDEIGGLLDGAELAWLKHACAPLS